VGPVKYLKIRNVQDVGVLSWATYELLQSLYRSPKMKQLLSIPKEIQSKSCAQKSEPRTVLCTDTHQQCIAICSRKTSCWYCTYSGTGEQEGVSTVQARSIQKILMTCTGERHHRTGMSQGADIEMYCPHVITDQILIACKKKSTQRKAAMSLSFGFSLSAYFQGTESPETL